MNRPNIIMRFVAVIAALAFALPSMAQNAKVTLSLQPTSLKSLFSAIERQTDYRFSYDSSIGKRKISSPVNKKQTPVSTILKDVLPTLGLEYNMLSDRVIAVSEKKHKGEAAAARGGAAARISGKVTDGSGEPLTGATIAVDGTRMAAVADIDGKFSLQAAPGQTLRVSLVVMTPVKVKVKAGQTDYNIEMKGDDKTLDQVVVVGYGTMQKKRVTSSITSVSGDDLMSGLGGATIATALQGKVSGLTISGSASPNSDNGYQLRGVSSVKGGTSPLIVIDGIPGGDLRAINQEDIESIDWHFSS